MAAGLGFKTFTTGEVLTAADTNGYLMQGINVFANSAARAAAITSPQEGQYSYLKDTNALEYYDGAAWVGAPVGDITAVTAGKGLTGGGASGDVTVSLATSAKGDLVVGTGTTTAAALTVGNNGETLVADSSASTGLRYQSNFSAGKNAIINGAFDVWQRGTSITVPIANFSYSGPDRFLFSRDGSGSVVTCSRQAFTPGTAPVAGYEGNYFTRFNQTTAGTGGNYNQFETRIENVTTFAGQTVTFSFWAKADSSRTMSTSLILTQNFGSGGSGSVSTTITLNSLALTTSWARYTGTVTLPSISGKTIGTSSFLAIDMKLFVNTTFTFDTWGWQLEAGSVATAFQTATGTLQGELAACQRYFNRIEPAGAYTGAFGSGYSNTTSVARIILNGFGPQMRTSPSVVFGTASNFVILDTSAGNIAATAITTLGINKWGVSLSVTTAASQTVGRGVLLGDNGTTSATIDLSSEL